MQQPGQLVGVATEIRHVISVPGRLPKASLRFQFPDVGGVDLAILPASSRTLTVEWTSNPEPLRPPEVAIRGHGVRIPRTVGTWRLPPRVPSAVVVGWLLWGITSGVAAAQEPTSTPNPTPGAEDDKRAADEAGFPWGTTIIAVLGAAPAAFGAFSALSSLLGRRRRTFKDESPVRLLRVEAPAVTRLDAKGWRRQGRNLFLTGIGWVGAGALAAWLGLSVLEDDSGIWSSLAGLYIVLTFMGTKTIWGDPRA